VVVSLPALTMSLWGLLVIEVWQDKGLGERDVRIDGVGKGIVAHPEDSVFGLDPDLLS